MRLLTERIATRKNTGAVLAAAIKVGPVLRHIRAWFSGPVIGLILFTRITVTMIRF